jgi:hypothetical protein
MIKSDGGFLIISVCVYLACFMMLVMVGSQVLWPGLVLLQSRCGQCQSLVDMHMACDLFIRDLWEAPADSALWHLYTDKAIIWSKKKEEAVGWLISDEGIHRMQGLYDPKTQRWQKNIQSVVLKLKSTHAYFIIERTSLRMQTVCMEITEKNQSIQALWSFYGR